jgi:ferritin
MISKKLVDAINDQINFELLSSYLYLSMSAFMEDNNYPGAAHFMRKQAEEEVAHAMKFFKFLVEVGARVELKTIPVRKSNSQVTWKSSKCRWHTKKS